MIDKYFAIKKKIFQVKDVTDGERRKSISYKGGINATVRLSGNKLKETNYLNGERQLYLKHQQDF